MRNFLQWVQNPKKALMLIMITAVLLRVITSVAFFGNQIQDLPGTFDEVSYHNLAIRVMDGHGFSFGEPWWPGTAANEPTAHWSYLYTSFLIGVYSIFGRNPLVARVIQSVLVGIVMPWLVYRLSCRVFGRNADANMLDATDGLRREQKIGLIVAAISAVYVYFFYYAASLITEGFYIVGILWTFDTAVSIAQSKETTIKSWLLLGVALGFTVLLRQLILLFAPFMLLWLWLAKRGNIFYYAVPLMVTAVFMLPWTLRNYNAFDTIVPLNTNSGHAFFWGNHPRYGTKFTPILPTAVYYAMVPEELKAQGLNEAEMDSALLKLGLEFVVEDPGRYIQLSLSRIAPYFMFWPSAESSPVSNVSRVASFGLFLPFMLYGLVLSVGIKYSSWMARLTAPFTLFYLFMLVYAGMHILTWTLIRYRVPIDAIFILFAGWAILDLSERIQARRGQQVHKTVGQNM
ncbi:MAG: glycosyltransferase family 39 protein [Chloroflexi bacterium]|nr:glycosyltransferase family 39 protein [Chloroflexota bacterium]